MTKEVIDHFLDVRKMVAISSETERLVAASHRLKGDHFSAQGNALGLNV